MSLRAVVIGGVLTVLGVSPAQALDIKKHPALAQFLDAMAQRHSFEPQELQRWFGQAEIKRDILNAIARPREALPWHQYKKSFVKAELAQKGAAYWRRHSAALTRAQAQYQVPPEIILAIIGVETQFGRNTGRYAVIDALTTLAFAYPPRADFFRGELEQFLLLARDLRLDPLKLKGSYAGAMGIGQFIPSSYRNYAVDFDGDGQRDLFNNADDAIGSVANYFYAHGWKSGEPVISAVRADNALLASLDTNELEPKLGPEQLRKYGIVPLAPGNPALPATVLRLQDAEGPLYLLGYHNFYVITRYNRSRHYALAVYELAQLIRAEYDSEIAFPLGPRS